MNMLAAGDGYCGRIGRGHGEHGIENCNEVWPVGEKLDFFHWSIHLAELWLCCGVAYSNFDRRKLLVNFSFFFLGSASPFLPLPR